MRAGLTVCALLALAGAILFGCAIDPGPFFSPGLTPDSGSKFLNGDLGLITSDLSPFYELLAFRALSGLSIKGLTEASNTAGYSSGTASWIQTRNKVKDPRPPQGFLNPDRRLTPSYVSYSNCLPDAFATAARTLTDRQSQYQDPAVFRAWVAAQDQVFEDCSVEKPLYPAVPESNLPELARADRVYQIAAAHFYAQDLATAAGMFQAISQDVKSPWSKTAAYLLGRTYLRQLSLEGSVTGAQNAREQFEKIANDSSFGLLQGSARGLLLRLDALGHPERPMQALGEQFLAPQADPAVSDALHQSEYILRANLFAKTLQQPNLPEPFDWVATLQQSKASHAIERWRSLHNLPWLTLALMEASGKDDVATDLWSEASRLAPSSPAFGTATYNAIRLRIERGQASEARAQLDSLLGNGQFRDAGVLNGWRAERMRVAVTFDDLLRWAPRFPLYATESRFADPSPVLAQDAVHVLNFETPLTKLVVAAASSRLEPWTRNDIALAAWTRAFMLNDTRVLAALAPAMSQAHSNWNGTFSPPASAQFPGWKFRAALLIARHSDFRPTVLVDYRRHLNNENWWCTVAPPTSSGTEEKGEVVAWRLPVFFSVPESVISSAETSRTKEELQKLTEIGAAQNFLGPIILDWARTHPSDPDVPEALHRLIRIIRYGCARTDPVNGRYSKAAFDLLHDRYPQSEWTRKTAYWFQ